MSADASLAVLGVDAVDAGVELRGDPLDALLIGAGWGAVAGAAGALLARLRPPPVLGRPPTTPAQPPRPGPHPGTGPGSNKGPGRGPGQGPGRGAPPDAPADPYRPAPGHRPAKEGSPCIDPDVSWDVTVTGLPPKPPRPARRPPFVPPPPPPPPSPPG